MHYDNYDRKVGILRESIPVFMIFSHLLVVFFLIVFIA